MISTDKQHNGVFIVLEGTDGSGKGTQFKLLAQKLKAAGHDVALFDFPQYDAPSSYFVKKYLNGDYGSAEQVGPYTGSIFYALDRYDAAAEIGKALDDGKVVLANRFTGSNMAHQGTKFENAEERRGYFIWLDNLEFETLKIPRPTVNVVLRVPAKTAQQLVDQKEARSYTDKKRDLHEADLSHLERAVEVYDDLCQLFPKDFVRIDCVRDDQLMAIDDISKLLYQKVEPMLPETTGKDGSITERKVPKLKQALEETAKPVSQSAPAPQPQPEAKRPGQPEENPYLKKDQDGYHITDAGKSFLEEAVTNTTGDVYAFSEKLSPVTIAAAMARLSRRGDDMRVTVLDEFAHAMEKDSRKDEQLLHRVITAYGDDSVQQLVGIHLAVENSSNWLTKKLEWGRLASYLEQSTRYIYYDQKDATGKYKYHTPTHFDPATTKAYNQALDQIFDTYSLMVRRLTDHIREHSNVPENERDGAWRSATKAQACDAVRPVLPVATVSTVGIFASGQALESLIMHLLADEMPEARATGQKLLDEARKIVPAFLERADKPERGGAMTAYRANTYQSVKHLADTLLPSNYTATAGEPVTLTSVFPRNELDLVPDMLYEHSNLSLRDIEHAVDRLPYEQKTDIFNAYIGDRLNRRMRPGRALEKAHYSWDLVCDYGIFRDLQRHRMVDDMEWQALTPRFGFDVPQLIEDAGLTEEYESCFDMSLALYSLLQQNGYALEAQYATLLGHKMRWKVTYNAREAFHLHELRTAPQGHPGYRKLVGAMHQKLAEVHPRLAEAMKFVNRDEDPELTRLAAERYTQYKLSRFDDGNTGT